MKVKIESGRLVVEDDNNKGFFNITTPNGHTLCLPSACGVVDDTCETRLFLKLGLDSKDIEFILKYSMLATYILFGLKTTNPLAITYIYDIGSETWISEGFCSDEHKQCEVFAFNICHVEQRLINRILAHDRECENTKYLRIIGTFCEHLLTRPQILDHFSHVATTINQQMTTRENENANVNDEKSNKVKL